MQVTVSAQEPLILVDVLAGDLFLLHVPTLDDCVFALLSAERYPTEPNRQAVVCVGSRVGPNDNSFVPTGVVFDVSLDSPVTLLDQVEPAAFRGRPVPAAERIPVLDAVPCTTGTQAQPEPISRL